jgi:hypothetical protein
MGKKKRRLFSPKFESKFARWREAIGKARGVVAEAVADGIVTKEEASQISEAQVAVDEAAAELAPKKAVTKKKKTSKKKKENTA